MSFLTPRGQPTQSMRMTSAPMMSAPVTYAAPPQMVFASPPQQQLAVVEQPQMVFAAAPAVPQQQLAIQCGARTNPNDLFQGGRVRTEAPISRGELIQQGRLFEGEMERPPVIFPGQMINLQQLQMQQPQMMEQVFAAPPPMTYAQVPALTVVDEPLAYGLAPPTVQYAGMSAGSAMVEQVQYVVDEPTVQYAAPPTEQYAVQYAVEEEIIVQAVPLGSQPGVVVMDPYGEQPPPMLVGVAMDPYGEQPPEMLQPMTKTGTMVATAPNQGHMIAQTAPVLSGQRGTITNALFDMLDANADGKISRSEFRRGLKGEIIQVGQVSGLPMR